MGDNLDLTVQVREMRSDNKDKSLHFFHYFAVKDRINSSHLSRYQPQCLATSLPLSAFYPSADDYTHLCDNFVVHLARIAVSKFACSLQILERMCTQTSSSSLLKRCFKTISHCESHYSYNNLIVQSLTCNCLMYINCSYLLE